MGDNDPRRMRIAPCQCADLAKGSRADRRGTGQSFIESASAHVSFLGGLRFPSDDHRHGIGVGLGFSVHEDAFAVVGVHAPTVP